MFKKTATFAMILFTVATSNAFAYDSNDFSNYSGTEIRGRSNNKSYNEDFRRKHNYPRNEEQQQDDQRYEAQTANPQGGDSDIVAAAERRRRLNFVEGSGMVVTKLLPDDRNGLQHQKWVVRLSNGQEMMAVYNIDMCPRVPLKVGDVVAMGGQFIYTNDGPLLHWLHFDPKKSRPDGYVEVNGQAYCKDGERR